MSQQGDVKRIQKKPRESQGSHADDNISSPKRVCVEPESPPEIDIDGLDCTGLGDDLRRKALSRSNQTL